MPAVRPLATRGASHAFTVDVEDWFHGIPMTSRQRATAERRIELGLMPLLDLLAARSIQATFFILGLVARERPDLVIRIADDGHEICCHGWSHDPIYAMTRERFRDETAQAKDTLEQITGRAVAGYRAPFFSIVRKTLWALEDLVELGFQYDSSIFPIRNWRYGLPEFPAQPTCVETSAGSIKEFPIGVRKFAGLTLPLSGGAYFRLYPYSLTRRHFKAATNRGEAAVFYVHPWELDSAHPTVRFDWRARMTHYANLTTTMPKLERLVREFKFGPLRAWRNALCDESFGRAREEVVVTDGRGCERAAAD